MAIKVRKATASTTAKTENDNDTAAAAKKTAATAKKTAAAAGTTGATGTTTTGKKKNTKSERSRIFSDRVVFSAQLMAKQTLTDEEIIDKVNEKFPDYAGKKFDQKECGRTRWMLGAKKIKDYPDYDKCHDRVYLIDGKKYKKENRPKKSTTKKQKVDPATDPLNTVAGMNIGKNDNEPNKDAKTESKISKKKRV